jgi:hypothetical protein
LLLAPYDKFAEDVAEIVALLNKPLFAIDEQIQSFEEGKKEERNALR